MICPYSEDFGRGIPLDGTCDNVIITNNYFGNTDDYFPWLHSEDFNPKKPKKQIIKEWTFDPTKVRWW